MNPNPENPNQPDSTLGAGSGPPQEEHRPDDERHEPADAQDTEVGNALDGLLGLQQQQVHEDLPAVPVPDAPEKPGDGHSPVGADIPALRVRPRWSSMN